MTNDLFNQPRDGETFDQDQDGARLDNQHRRVLAAISDGQWRTLGQIEAITGDAQDSISARLQDFRTVRFGSMNIERRKCPGRGPTSGLFQYRLVVEA